MYHLCYSYKLMQNLTLCMQWGCNVGRMQLNPFFTFAWKVINSRSNVQHGFTIFYAQQESLHTKIWIELFFQDHDNICQSQDHRDCLLYSTYLSIFSVVVHEMHCDKICSNRSCMVKGGRRIVKLIFKKLTIAYNSQFKYPTLYMYYNVHSVYIIIYV